MRVLEVGSSRHCSLVEVHPDSPVAEITSVLEAVFEYSLAVQVTPEGMSVDGSGHCPGDGRDGIDGSV